MSAPVLSTKNFNIRAFTRQDLDNFAKYRSQETVARYQDWANFTAQDAVELFERMDYSTFGTQGQWYQLAIAMQTTNELVGDLAIHFLDQHQVEIGCTVSPEHQRKSVATQAISSFLDFAFTELNQHRVVATTDTQNKAAYRLLEQLGFRREAHFVKNVFFKGAWGDEYLYAMLRSERIFA